MALSSLSSDSAVFPEMNKVDEEVAKLDLPALREELTSSHILFADFLKAGLVMNIVSVVIGILIIYGMGSSPEPKSVEFR